MEKSRSDFTSLRASIEYHKDKYVFLKDKIISLSTQSEYDRTIKHYDDLTSTLSNEIAPAAIRF